MSMVRLSSALAGALLLAAPAFANAPPPPPAPPVEATEMMAPEIYVKSLYDTKLESMAVSPEFGAAMSDSIVLYHFTADLLALYKKAADTGEPVIDSDIFLDAQDWESLKFDVATKTTANDGKSATVEVTFKLDGNDRKFIFALKAQRDSWQIDDITGMAGSMRAWLAKGVAEAGGQ